MEPISFIITIPVRDQELSDIKDAFISKQPYNAPVPPDKVLDNAGNLIDNPITKENYIEDCIGYFILETTKAYLVEKAAKIAKDSASKAMDQNVTDLATWIRG